MYFLSPGRWRSIRQNRIHLISNHRVSPRTGPPVELLDPVGNILDRFPLFRTTLSRRMHHRVHRIRSDGDRTLATILGFYMVLGITSSLLLLIVVPKGQHHQHGIPLCDFSNLLFIPFAKNPHLRAMLTYCFIMVALARLMISHSLDVAFASHLHATYFLRPAIFASLRQPLPRFPSRSKSPFWVYLDPIFHPRK